MKVFINFFSTLKNKLKTTSAFMSKLHPQLWFSYPNFYVINNNTFKVSFIFCITPTISLDHRVFSFFIVSVLIMLFKKYFTFWKELVFTSIMGSIIFLHPIFNYIFMVVIIGVFVILALPNIYFLNAKVKAYIITHIWESGLRYGIISYLLLIYKKTFIDLPTNSFKFRISLLYLGIFLYYVFTKFLLLNFSKIFSLNFQTLLICNILFLFSFFCFFFRIVLSLSLLTHQYYPIFMGPQSLVFVEGLDSGLDPHGPNPPHYTHDSPKSKFTLYQKNIHNYYTNSSQTPKNVNFYRVGGFVIGLLGVGIASYTAYLNHMQTAANLIQAKELARQNDLEELAQNLITKEEYRRRYPPS